MNDPMVPFLATQEKDCYILNLNCSDTNLKSLCNIEDFLKKHRNKKLGLNLEKIEHIGGEFVELLNNFRFLRLSVFNANPNVLGYMAITNTLNLVPVYMSKNDFLQEKRKFVKRDFRVVK